MNTGIAKAAIVAGVVVMTGAVVYFAFSHPGYFTSQTYLGGLVFLEFLAGAVWLYRKVFFPLVIVTFLLAGVDLPLGSVWTMARWVVLAAGAMVGTTIMLRERRHSFGTFHVLALFCVLASLTSAAVSRYTMVSSLKVLSLFLLFLYASTGARLAVANRESRFFTGLLAGCEIFVAAIAAFYLIGRDVMGNPNSLGAVMGVAAAPILLWGILLKQERFSYRRRLFLFAIAMYLAFGSHARAGILAALISCTLLCLVMRKFALLTQGVGIMVILIAAMAIFQPEVFSASVTSFTSTIVYKGKNPTEGLLGSRKSPWQDTVDAIHEHFWFGSGFGTSDNGQDPTDNLGSFASSSVTSTEHGSSYLEIVAWTGMLGVLPFLLLLGFLLKKIFETLVWMVKTANPSHPAVPLAMFIIAALIHAAFEDWLFAPGYYLCAFFWSIAFIFIDQVRTLPATSPRVMFVGSPAAMRRDMGAIAPSQ